MIASNNPWTQAGWLPGRLIPDQYVLPCDCALGATRTQERVSLFHGVASNLRTPRKTERIILSRVQYSHQLIDLALKLPRLPMLWVKFESFAELAERGLILALLIQRLGLLKMPVRQSPVVLPRAIYRRRVLIPPIPRAGVCSRRRRYDAGRIRRRRLNIRDGRRRPHGRRRRWRGRD